MRIISGNFKGKQIIQPVDRFTRPLKDLVKESIFNILNHSKKINIKLEDAYVLDLFSGVGSFGLECLSRGVKFVTFVENYKIALDILKKNLINLKSQNNYSVLKKNIINELDFTMLNQNFSIIFLDPPYKEKKLDLLLNKIINNKILTDNGIIIIHRHKKTIDQFPSKLKVIEQKNYGISKIIFLSV